jgi:hypothetical protein
MRHSGLHSSSKRHATPVFFSGDTGLTTEYQSIRERFGPFDLAMLEVGAFHPAWGDIHLGPENALKALTLLGNPEISADSLGNLQPRNARMGPAGGSAVAISSEIGRAAGDAAPRRTGRANR